MYCFIIGVSAIFFAIVCLWGFTLRGIGERRGGLLGILGQDVTEEVSEELPTGQAPIVDDDALDLTMCSEAPVEVQDILIEDELGRTHSTAERRAVVVATAQALLIGDRYFGDEGIQAIFVHLAEVHAQALEELMSRMLHVVLVVGVVDDAL